MMIAHPSISRLAAGCPSVRLLALGALFTDCAAELDQLVQQSGRRKVSVGDLYDKLHRRLSRGAIALVAVAPTKLGWYLRRCVRNLVISAERKELSARAAEHRRMHALPPSDVPSGWEARIEEEDVHWKLDRVFARLREQGDEKTLDCLERLLHALRTGAIETCTLRTAAEVLGCSHTACARLFHGLARGSTFRPRHQH
jgi:hypothetical protein